MKVFELSPINNRKSFYGKAKVLQIDKDNIYLQSYNTIVCGFVNDIFERYWDGYSSTTMNHINSFLQYCGIFGGGKAWWLNQPIVDKEIEISVDKL